METKEAFKLLTLASARDGRTVDAAVAAVWADDLADVSFMDAVEAAKAHYRESSKWLMPAHVIERVNLMNRRKNVKQFQALTMSPEIPDCGNHRWMPDGTCMTCETRRDR